MARTVRPAGAVGVPAGAPRLDAHAHVMSASVADLAERLSKRRSLQPLDAGELLRRMDAAGIQRAAVHSTAYMMATDALPREVPVDQERRDVEAENDFAARECRRDPNRLIPFLSVNPKRDYAVAEIDRAVDHLGMRGLKLHLWNSLVDTREAEPLAQLRRVVAHAATRNLPVLIHAFVGAVKGYGPEDTERLVREVIEPLPTLRICVAHAAGAGGFGGTAQRCLDQLATSCQPGTPLGSRVWIDTAAVLSASASPAIRQRFAELIRRWGVERVFWGSDSFESALAASRESWPLDEAAWATLCGQDGVAWLGA